MAKERGTFLIELSNGGRVVFGNNYKKWYEHAREFMYRTQGDREAMQARGWHYDALAGSLVKVSYSNQPFYDDGGLKWCDINSYQEVIDEVCERDKLAPVKVADIVFTEMPKYKAVLTKKLKEY